MRNETDKHDAGGIAQILRSGWYSRVHVKSVESHHLRALLSCRKVMQRKCIDLEYEIRGLLKVFGVKLPLRLSRGGFDIAVRDTIESDPRGSRRILTAAMRSSARRAPIGFDRHAAPARDAATH
jgi:transposase